MALINCPECNKEISDKANTCPSCGHPMEKSTLAPSADTFKHDPNKKMCPSCNSKNTQTIKMMCFAGSTSSASTAIGINTDLDIGVAKIKTNSKSTLASMYDPGDKKSPTLDLILLAIGLIFLLLAAIFSEEGLGYLGMFAMIGGLIGIFKTSSANDIYNSKVDKFENGWICLKCGNTWIPDILPEWNAPLEGKVPTHQQLDDIGNAIFLNDIVRLNSIIATGIDLNVKNNYGVTPLQMARNCDSEELVSILKKAGAKK